MRSIPLPALLALAACVEPAIPSEPDASFPAGLSQARVTLEGNDASFADRTGTPLFQARFSEWGRPGAERPPGAGVHDQDCATASPTGSQDCGMPHRLRHEDGLTSWWVAAPSGHQQGWTIDDAPSGSGELRFSTELDGVEGLHTDGTSAGFTDGAGRSWTVSGLAAWDAEGADLPIWTEAGGSTLDVVVDDAGASYPITVDPIYSSPDVTIAGGDGGADL